MAIEIISGFRPYAQEAIDTRIGPWDSTATLLDEIDEFSRYQGQQFIVIESGIAKLYYFKEGTDDIDLVEFTSGSGGGNFIITPPSISEAQINDPFIDFIINEDAVDWYLWIDGSVVTVNTNGAVSTLIPTQGTRYFASLYYSISLSTFVISPGDERVYPNIHLTADLAEPLDRVYITSILIDTDYAGGITSITLSGDVTGTGGSSITTTIANNAVTTSKINDSAVTTSKINDSAVTTNKVNDSAITTGKINDDAVTNDKLSNMAANTVKANNTSSTAGPSDVAMTASTTLARLAAGDIVAASVAQMKTLYGFVDITTTENVGGIKTFTGANLNVNGVLRPLRVNNTTSGAINNLALTSSVVSFTNATSLSGAAPISTGYSDFLILINKNTVTLNLLNQSGSSSAANRFQLPGGVDLPLASGSSVMFVYDSNAQRWSLVGVSSGALTNPLLAGTNTRVVEANSAGTLSATKPYFDPQIMIQNTDLTLTDTVTETSILSADIGSKNLLDGELEIGKFINFKVSFEGSTNAAGEDITIRIDLDSVTEATVVLPVPILSTSSFYGEIDFDLNVKTTGATGTCNLIGDVTYFDDLGNNFKLPIREKDVVIDTTDNIVFDITGEWGAASTDLIFTTNQADIKYLN